VKRYTYADRGNGGSKFDLQLGGALIDEDRLAQRLQSSKLELKTERFLWEITGNLCIEYRWNGKPSGIAATDADFWVHELARGDETLAYIMIPVQRLREICRRNWRAGHYRECVGDNGLSGVVLVKISDLLTQFRMQVSA